MVVRRYWWPCGGSAALGCVRRPRRMGRAWPSSGSSRRAAWLVPRAPGQQRLRRATKLAGRVRRDGRGLAVVPAQPAAAPDPLRRSDGQLPRRSTATWAVPRAAVRGLRLTSSAWACRLSPCSGPARRHLCSDGGGHGLSGAPSCSPTPGGISVLLDAAGCRAPRPRLPRATGGETSVSVRLYLYGDRAASNIAARRGRSAGPCGSIYDLTLTVLPPNSTPPGSPTRHPARQAAPHLADESMRLGDTARRPVAHRRLASLGRRWRFPLTGRCATRPGRSS